ncbi:MAG: carbohydrate ABC transporter substrate-binding protein, partial [Oscillospiraceae bacterium]|nr:carbohydrate ABC transporter substrate-binding protein [Oscillospiraceae bacterium]
MKKRTIRIASLLLALTFCLGLMAGCKNNSDSPGGTTAEKTINVWSFTDEVPNMINKYKELNPSFPYNFNITIIATTHGAYQPALDQALGGSGGQSPDIYTAEAAFVLKYSQGDAKD